jgi:hypothetical protein
MSAGRERAGLGCSELRCWPGTELSDLDGAATSPVVPTCTHKEVPCVSGQNKIKLSGRLLKLIDEAGGRRSGSGTGKRYGVPLD